MIQTKNNPIAELRERINDFEDAMEDRGFISLLQVPRHFVRDLLKLTAPEWKQHSNGWIDDKDIDEILHETSVKGASGLSGFKFGTTTIRVAGSDEEDCEEFKILE
ncbi:hypothetical protein JO972_16650 [Verrucomicrobiaceae bacterium 5K15]|uniref:Uncharacterized protein n=1 Tax=Oceaniferula flava TaxID=2800421 RepID=A0AAE2SHR0_9BACT|nr:hypothetical protein [Oceaniferula flavus]MBK1856596.1 hypothetical protein [Oceaniferula flavus]MBM1137904.1 hypothetical protein [Oceaniferula flavus]